ncbi:hypothetical protein PMIN06_008513 [Paraphaeosphaeria minitans]|uniref:O-methyltransferase MdmC n=1 Tax=Paraphaeosphaeria minitans TaxID=565426 RepID=A0A9P6KM98_9PLEO|nr:O-methyltransferase MdmC [Paraphaeosphaeria minitans]
MSTTTTERPATHNRASVQAPQTFSGPRSCHLENRQGLFFDHIVQKNRALSGNAKDDFDRLLADKFIALGEDKCQFAYQLITAMGTTSIVEAGTSFGVSTIYLALAVAQTSIATGTTGRVIATENEPRKAAAAREHWRQCGELVERSSPP